jgi:hypothetical protein
LIASFDCALRFSSIGSNNWERLTIIDERDDWQAIVDNSANEFQIEVINQEVCDYT